VPIYYDALGTVQALNTVAIRAQVNGQDGAEHDADRDAAPGNC